MYAICNPSIPIVFLSEFGCSSLRFVKHNSMMNPNLRSLSFIESVIYFNISAD